jgi:ribonuclease-3
VTAAPDGGLEALEARIGHRFADRRLLRRALTHTGVSPHPDQNYERLEFLGDRVLGLVVARLVYDAHPAASEGELARRFNALVNRDACAGVARALGLGAHIRLDPGEQKTGGRDKPVILGDVMEALIAALYLDAGLDIASAFVAGLWRPLLTATPGAAGRDPKSALQEWAQAQGLALPVYAVVGRSGPDHAPNFVISVTVDGFAAAEAEGPSRRIAEQNAARALLVREKVWSA